MVENIVRNGENACYKQFLLFSQRFPQLYIFSASKCGIVHGNGLKLGDFVLKCEVILILVE